MIWGYHHLFTKPLYVFNCFSRTVNQIWCETWIGKCHPRPFGSNADLFCFFSNGGHKWHIMRHLPSWHLAHLSPATISTSLGVLSCRTTLSTPIFPVDNCGMLQLNVTCTASLPAGFFSYVLAAGGEYGWWNHSGIRRNGCVWEFARFPRLFKLLSSKSYQTKRTLYVPSSHVSKEGLWFFFFLAFWCWYIIEWICDHPKLCHFSLLFHQVVWKTWFRRRRASRVSALLFYLKMANLGRN